MQLSEPGSHADGPGAVWKSVEVSGRVLDNHWRVGRFSTNSLVRWGQDRVKTLTPARWFQRIHILNLISVSDHFQGKLIEHKIEI